MFTVNMTLLNDIQNVRRNPLWLYINSKNKWIGRGPPFHTRGAWPNKYVEWPKRNVTGTICLDLTSRYMRRGAQRNKRKIYKKKKAWSWLFVSCGW